MISADVIKQKRLNLGLSQKEFSILLGLRGHGERTVRGWENGEHEPSAAKLEKISGLKTETPYKFLNRSVGLKSVDLFAGIGGIRLAFQTLGCQCIFSSEWDKFAQKTYAANFGELPKGDIGEIRAEDIPNHDILLAGFPCQAFSQAGLKNGFNDTRGTLFFDIQRILVAKRPKMFLLENVKQLKGHDGGRTFATILSILKGEHGNNLKMIDMSQAARDALNEQLNYWVDFKVLKSTDFGLPQNRQRIFILGFNKDYYGDIDFETQFSWPLPNGIPTSVRQILQSDNEVEPKYTISQKLLEGHERRRKEHKEKGNGFGFSVFRPEDKYTNTISARYYKDGSEILIDQSALGRRPRKLTPRECARLQGFPEDFIVDAVSDAQAYKQFGNSVSVPVVQAIAAQMLYFDRMHSKDEKTDLIERQGSLFD